MRAEDHERLRQEKLKYWGAFISMTVIGSAVAYWFEQLRWML